MTDPLSIERIQLARETLMAAFGVALRDGFPGAIDCREEPFGIFCEAKRNLTALVQWKYGNEAWERVLAADEGEPEEDAPST